MNDRVESASAVRTGFVDEITDGDLVGCGSRVVLLNLLRGLDRRRFSPVVFTPAEGRFAEAVRATGADAIVGRLPGAARMYMDTGRHGTAVISGISANLSAAPGLMLEWKRQFVAAGLDMVYLSTFFSHVAGSAAAFMAGIPSVCHIQGEVQASRRIRLMVGPYRAWCAAFRSTMVAISDHVARSADVPGFPRPQVIYNGVDTEIMKPSRSPAIGGHAGRTVGLVSSISPLKRIDLLPEVAELVVRHVPDAQFVVVGGTSEPSFLESIKSRLNAAGLNDHVTFTGALDSLQNVYPTFDLLLHLTPVEGFGMVIAEAMSCGIPVVATNRGGPAEVIEHEKTGLLVNDPDDIPGLAQAVAAILSDGDMARRMGSAARKRVVDTFSMKMFACRFNELFEQTVSRRRGRL